MNIFKSLLNKLKIGLALGMKAADEELVHSNTSIDDVDSGVHQQVTDKRVAKHLLKGEITQEVEELRYRTYLVDRESKDFDFYSPVKAVRKQKDDTRRISYENNENLYLITVQENRHIGDDVYDALENIDIDKMETDDNGEVKYNLGKLQKKHNYTIKLGRNEYTVPRYRLEEYTKKLVCLSMDETEKKALNFIKFNGNEIEEISGFAPTRAYYCTACGGWHVTHLPKHNTSNAATEKHTKQWRERFKEKKKRRPRKNSTTCSHKSRRETP